MARERMVTRTVTTNECRVVAVNLADMSINNLTVFAPADVDTIEKADKFFRKNWDSGNGAFAKVITVEPKEELYGMTEVEFMKHARILPPRGTKEE